MEVQQIYHYHEIDVAMSLDQFLSGMASAKSLALTRGSPEDCEICKKRKEPA